MNVVFRAYRAIDLYVTTPKYAAQHMAMNYIMQGCNAVKIAMTQYDLCSADVDLSHFYLVNKDYEQGPEIRILLPNALQGKSKANMHPNYNKNTWCPPSFCTYNDEGMDADLKLNEQTPKDTKEKQFPAT